MKKTKIKILAMAMALVMVAVSSSLLTLAYLQDSTEDVVNTFSNSAKVKITLDEAKVDVYGNAGEDAARVKANAYKLIPNHTYTKDPTIHVEAGSEECWLFVKVVNPLMAIEADTTIAAQMAANGWTALDDVANVYYHAVVDARTAQIDVTVFETLSIKADASFDNYTDARIVITGYAVQADGFSTAKAAWDAANFN